MNAIFRHDYSLAVEPESTPRPLVQKKTWRDSLPIDILLSVVSVLVVAQSSSEIPEGLTNNPVYVRVCKGYGCDSLEGIIPPSLQVRSLFRKRSGFEPNKCRTGMSYRLQFRATLVLVHVALCLGN